MPSTFFGLNIGASGLYTYQAAINTSAHNVSNVETKGYTRQTINQKAGIPISVNNRYGMVGSGVDVTGITQIRNDYYDLKYRTSNNIYGAYSAKQYTMKEIENYFNEVTFSGFTTSFNKLFDALQTLNNSSAGMAERTQVTNFAQNLADYFNSMATNLRSVQEECNFEVKNQVDRINSLAQQIASLTKQINVLESGGGTANDLRDQRQLLLDDLSYIVNITYEEKVVGNNVGVTTFTVKIDGQTLVSTDRYNTLQVVPREEKINQNDADGLYDIVWSSTGNNFSTKSSSLQGYLKALIEVRDGNNNEKLQSMNGQIEKTTVEVDDGNGNKKEVTKFSVTVTNTNINSIEKLNIPDRGVITIGNEEYVYESFTVTKDANGNLVYKFNLEGQPRSEDISGKKISVGYSIDYKGIPYYMGQLNELVRTFAKAFNDLHKSGVDLDGNAGVDFFTAGDKVSGKDLDLKDYLDYYKLTSDNFKVSDTVYYDQRKIVTGTNIASGVEKNDVLEKLMALRNDQNMFKKGTPASFFQALIAEIGVDAKKATNFAKNQNDIVDMVQNQRLSVSGVDVNEESMYLIRFQHAYNLSAKVIQTMNEIYDKLINGTAV